MAKKRETELETALRHVREGEERVNRQRRIVRSGLSSHALNLEAGAALEAMEKSLQLAKDHLARLQAKG